MNWKDIAMVGIALVLAALFVGSIFSYIILNGKYSDLQQDYSKLEIEKQGLSNELSSTQTELNEALQNLQENITQLEEARSGNKYEMHDPTYQEVYTFIALDKTDQIPYDEDTFNCMDYATMINNNAEGKGIRCCVIYLDFKDSAYSHSIIGFDTTDSGMLYYEPQSDERVMNLKVGNDYWTECVIPKAGYYYAEDPDDTIAGIIEYW